MVYIKLRIVMFKLSAMPRPLSNLIMRHSLSKSFGRGNENLKGRHLFDYVE